MTANSKLLDSCEHFRKLAGEKVIAYHGGPAPIYRFNNSKSAMGVFWFSENLDSIIGGESGASSSKWIMKVRLDVGKIAGWKEYDKYSSHELISQGFDSIHLDDNWVIFDPDRIEIISRKKTKD